MNITKSTSPLLLALTIIACDTSEDVADLSGKFATPCHFAFKVAGTDIYESGVFVGTDKSYTLTLSLFVNPTCTAPYVTFTSQGDYVTRPSDLGTDIFELDATWTGRTMRADAEAALPSLNSGCGAPPWSVGQTQDIFASGCAVAGFRPSAQCVMDYDLVAITEGGISFGQRPQDNNMCTTDRRPIAVSPAVFAPAS